MTKPELIQYVAVEAGITNKSAQVIVDAIIEKIKAELKAGNEVSISSFGKFITKVNKEREGVNPQTSEKILIPAKTVVKFKVSPKLNEFVA